MLRPRAGRTRTDGWTAGLHVLDAVALVTALTLPLTLTQTLT